MDNGARDLFADFMRNLQGCGTVTVSLEGIGATNYTTKEIYEAIDFRVNRRAEQENKPLALDELRGMDGEPVWCRWPGCSTRGEWFIVRVAAFAVMNDNGALLFRYFEEWTAYRYKPKEDV